MCNYFGSLLFHFLRRGIIVELDYYFIVLIVEKRTRFFVDHYCRPSLWFGGSYCRYLLFFNNCKLVAYAILLLGLLLRKGFYIFERLPHLRWR